MALRDSEVDVFLALAQQHTQEVLPLLYTPTVAQVPCPLGLRSHACKTLMLRGSCPIPLCGNCCLAGGPYSRTLHC